MTLHYWFHSTLPSIFIYPAYSFYMAYILYKIDFLHYACFPTSALPLPVIAKNQQKKPTPTLLLMSTVSDCLT